MLGRLRTHLIQIKKLFERLLTAPRGQPISRRVRKYNSPRVPIIEAGYSFDATLLVITSFNGNSFVCTACGCLLLMYFGFGTLFFALMMCSEYVGIAATNA